MDTALGLTSSPVIDIDDAGNTISVYVKNTGTRPAVFAVRGTPGAAGVVPVWSQPLAVDSATAPLSSAFQSERSIRVVVAPNGNAGILYVGTAPCTTATYNTSGTCNYIYLARYTAATNSLTPPVRVIDAPSILTYLIPKMNSNGDFSLLYEGWVRSGTGFSVRPAVVWQSAVQTTFQNRVFSEVAFSEFDLGMDRSGNMLFAGSATQNSTRDMVVYRGNMATGFGAQEVIDQRSTEVGTNISLGVGLNGQAAVAWRQNSGTTESLYTAYLPTPGGAWSISDRSGVLSNGGFIGIDRTFVTDSGNAILLLSSTSCGRTSSIRYAAGVWSAFQPLPSAFAGNECNNNARTTFNRNGDALLFDSFQESGWYAYDATLNAFVQPPSNNGKTGAPYWSFPSTAGVGNSAAALSVTGVAAMTTSVSYDTLPTAASPNGDGRSSVRNLWGFILK